MVKSVRKIGEDYAKKSSMDNVTLCGIGNWFFGKVFMDKTDG